jgi:hypothetical protein
LVVEYRKEWVRFDVVAGLTTAAVVIPKAMAYATIAGLPVQIGSTPPGSDGDLRGSGDLPGSQREHDDDHRDPDGDEMGRVARMVTPPCDQGHGDSGAACWRYPPGRLRAPTGIRRQLHFRPGAHRFKAGIGLVIVLGPIAQVAGNPFRQGQFFHNLVATIREIPHTSVPTLPSGRHDSAAVGIEHLLPRAPAPLIAIAAGIAATSLFGLQAHGVAVVGQVPQGCRPSSRLTSPFLRVLWPGLWALRS